MFRQILTVFLAALTLTGALWGCTRQQVLLTNAQPALKAAGVRSDQPRLDVAVVVFDPGLDESDEQGAGMQALREAEARYMAYNLRRTLAETRFWSAVNVVPRSPGAADTSELRVRGRILASTGLQLQLEIEVADAMGRIWFTETFEGAATRYSYREDRLRTEDPFQGVYNAIADRMARFRENLGKQELARINLTSEMRFARDLLPDRFDGYVSESEDQRWQIQRMPADDDPMVERIRAIRKRDRAFLGVLDGYYGVAYRDMKPVYDGLRGASYEEMLALERLERSARKNMVLGSVAVVAGAAGVLASEGAIGQPAGAASVAAGVAVTRRGLDQAAEAEIHRDALQELNDSFDQAVSPTVVEAEGRVVTLTGSAQRQYQEWRELLRTIYRAEAGI